jgi:hypothetical protein
MRILTAAALGAVLLLPTPSFAASPIVTPSIPNSANGSLACWVVNASAAKTLEIEVEIRSFNGTVLESGEGLVEPLAANALTSDNAQARFCVVRVLRGGKKNAIVSLVATEDGSPVAVVQANR